jgi:hypothetical protein
MKRRIALITERANIALGGAERSAFELAAALSALGLQVDILAAKGKTNAKNIHILCPDASLSLFCETPPVSRTSFSSLSKKSPLLPTFAEPYF